MVKLSMPKNRVEKGGKGRRCFISSNASKTPFNVAWSNKLPFYKMPKTSRQKSKEKTNLRIKRHKRECCTPCA